MAYQVIPPTSGGGIKLVQRGSAGGAGTVTITAVNIAKAFVNVFGTASSGTVAASGAISGATGNIAATNLTMQGYASTFRPSAGSGNYNRNQPINATSFTGNATNLSGGSNNLVAAVVQGYLSSSTELVVSGACRWEVVEFN